MNDARDTGTDTRSRASRETRPKPESVGYCCGDMPLGHWRNDASRNGSFNRRPGAASSVPADSDDVKFEQIPGSGWAALFKLKEVMNYIDLKNGSIPEAFEESIAFRAPGLDKPRRRPGKAFWPARTPAETNR